MGAGGREKEVNVCVEMFIFTQIRKEEKLNWKKSTDGITQFYTF